MSKRGTDPFSAHEALDRAHLISVFFGDHLADHPFVQSIPKLKREAVRLAEDLAKFYQLVGTVAFEDTRRADGMTPVQLARELHIPAKNLRGWLRRNFPRNDAKWKSPWSLTPEQVRAARKRWAKPN